MAGRRLGPALGLSAVVAGAFPIAAALAQGTSIPFPGQAEPGRNVPAPAPPPAAPQFDFSIPAPQRGPVPRAVDVIEFDVTDITVVGSTKFPESAFKPLTDPLAGKKAKLSDIIDVADKIEAMYREHGYVLTRAFVPPQTVSNGHFKINVVEGFVKATAVTGGDDFTRDRVEAYLQPVTEEKPTTIDTMERGLLLANNLPGTQASGLLRPSPTEPGASDMLVNLTEPPWEATLYSDNRGAATTGVYTLGGQAVVNTLHYIPGQILIDLSGTPDFSQRRLLQTHYTRPVGLNGMILTVTYVNAHGVPVAAGGNLVSDSYAIGAQVSEPVLVSRALKVTLEGGFNIQADKVTASGTPVGVPAGVMPVYNDDDWRELNVAATGEYRGLYNNSTSSATLGITQGLPIFGAQSTSPFYVTTPPTPTTPIGASTGFTKETLVASHDQPISGPVSYNVHGLGQWTNERLIIGEQTSFGGSGIGRGYDPAALAGDIGYGFANELRYDAHFPQYHLDNVQYYVFYDFAQVRPLHDENPPAPGLATHRTLMSTGLGVRAALMQRLTGDIELAQELRGVPNNDSDKRDTRILFNAAIRF